MALHPLIPEADTYGIAILAVLSLSAFSLASHIYSRWGIEQRLSFMLIYALVQAIIIGWGFLTIGAEGLFGYWPLSWPLTVGLGIIIGTIANRCDRKIIRSLNRKRSLRSRFVSHLVVGRTNLQGGERVSMLSEGQMRGSMMQRRRSDPLAKVRTNIGAVAVEHELSVPSALAIGMMEEIIYRGILVYLCFLLVKPALVALALTCSIFLFGLSHIEFGWPHVVSKIPLGILALVGVLITGSVICAVIGHALFNIQVVVESRRQAAQQGALTYQDSAYVTGSREVANNE